MRSSSAPVLGEGGDLGRLGEDQERKAAHPPVGMITAGPER